MYQDLNIRVKTTEIIVRKIGNTLHNIGFIYDSLVLTPKTQATKERITLKHIHYRM